MEIKIINTSETLQLFKARHCDSQRGLFSIDGFLLIFTGSVCT